MRRNLLTHALIVAMEMDQLHAERANERRQAEERDAGPDGEDGPWAEGWEQRSAPPGVIEDGRQPCMPAALGMGYGSEA